MRTFCFLFDLCHMVYIPQPCRSDPYPFRGRTTQLVFQVIYINLRNFIIQPFLSDSHPFKEFYHLASMIYIYLKNFTTQQFFGDLHQFKKFYHLASSVIYIYLSNFITQPFLCALHPFKEFYHLTLSMIYINLRNFITQFRHMIYIPTWGICIIFCWKGSLMLSRFGPS